MKRKSLLITAALLSASIILSGCAAPAPSSSGSSASGATSSTQTPSTAETVNIDWFVSTGVVPSSWDQTQYVMKTITEKTGVTVSATTPAEDPDTKLNLMIASGALPDLITLSNDTLIKDMVDAKLVWNMQELFATHLPDSKVINGGFPNDVKEALTARDGDWYAFPSHILSKENREIWGLNPATEEMWLATDHRENRGIIFNKDIMDTLNITPEEVSTESGLLAAFEKVKAANLEVGGAKVMTLLADGNSYQGTNWASDSGAVGTLTAMFGGMKVDANGKYQSFYYNEPFAHAVKFLNTCAQNGYVNPNDFTMDRAAREAACRAGRVFCFIGNTADTGFYDIDNNGFAFYTPGVVLADTGESPVLGANRKVGRGWLQSFVSKNSQKADSVAKFIDYMASEEGLTLWGYGEPEVDYTLNADQLIARTTVGQEKASNAAVTGVGAYWAFCNQNFDQKYMDPTVDRGVAPQCAFGSNEKTVIFDSTALDDLPGGYIDSNTAMMNIRDEVKSYAQTELVNIILNATDADFDTRFTSFVAQLNNLGLPELDAYIDLVVQENYKTYEYTLKALN